MFNFGKRRTARRAAMASVAALVALTLAACNGKSTGDGGSGDADAGPPQSGGSMTVGDMFPVLADAPWAITGSITDGVVMRAIYDTLLYLTPDGKLQPDLATSWVASDGNTKFTFTLRSGVKFSDGTPFDATAAKWNFDQHLDPANASKATALVAQLASVEAPDATTLVVHTKKPYPAFLNALAVSAMSAMASPTALTKDPHTPVGAGPFVVVSYTPDQEIQLKRNPDYWQDGKPYLDNLTIRSILDNSTRTLSQQQGEVDATNYVEGEYFKQLEANGMVDKSIPATSFIMPMTTQRAPLNDPEIRKAAIEALDLDAINKALFQGAAVANPNVFPEGSPWLDDSVTWPKYDPDDAKKLVDDYKQRTGATDVSFTFSSDNINYMKTFAQLATQMWADVGITVKTQVLDTNVFIQKMTSGAVDIASWSLGSTVDPDLTFYGALHSGLPSNTTGYNNPEMDAALDAGRYATNEEDRKKAYDTVQELLAKDMPLFPWLQTNWGYSVSPKVHGFAINSDYTPVWADVWKTD